MDVKDIQPNKQLDVSKETGSKPTRQRTLQSLSSGAKIELNQNQTEAVAVQVANQRPSGNADGSARTRANKLISTAHMVEETASEIESLAGDIDKIAETATKSGTGNDINKLESQANKLVDKIADSSNKLGTNIPKVSNIPHDDVRFEIEATLGKALDSIFPPENIGLGQMSFSPKESIIETRATVARARERIDGLREAVRDIRGELSSAVSTLDVAAQNSEASQVSVRDLDSAIDLAGKATQSISENPDDAVGSIGAIERAGNLLES